MFSFFKKNAMKDFGLKAKEVKKYSFFHTIQYGEINDIKIEAKRLNKYCRKNDLKRVYFYQPCAGMPNMALLIVGHN